MAAASDESYITELYRILLGRTPLKDELDHWTTQIQNGLSDRQLLWCFVDSSEYKAKHSIVPGHPVGHYYSPVIDPDEARKFWRDKSALPPQALAGISISIPAMMEFWNKLKPILATTNFPAKQGQNSRYFFDNNVFPIGDAAILRAIIGTVRPKRIIEVGSGFSSACMLDALDEFAMNETTLLFIEPYPERLHQLLHTNDWKRTTLIEGPVQSVDLAVFDELVERDILFIDSSHVLKACSDVAFELFEILPRLKPGVLIHFHDIHYPFELPSEWIFEAKYSWNEVYALRAFLMYNTTFRNLAFNSLFDQMRRQNIADTAPQMLHNPGASIWLEKCATDG